MFHGECKAKQIAIKRAGKELGREENVATVGRAENCAHAAVFVRLFPNQLKSAKNPLLH